MKIRVDAYSLTPSAIAVGTVGSYGVPKLECSFSPEWEGLTIKASFYAGDDDYVVLLNDAGEATVPAEIMAEAGEYPFLISGCRGTTEIRSLAGKLTVLPTLEPAVTPPGSPTPSEMAQIFDMLEEAQELSESAVSCISEARAAASDAEQGASAANAAANVARSAAERAYSAASRCVWVSQAEIAENGHLKLTMSGGAVIDAGVCRGSAVSDEYAGNGGVKSVTVGFRPALLFLTKTSDGCVEGETVVISGSGYLKNGVQLVTLNADGFSARRSGTDGWNTANVTYRYVAFADDPNLLSFELSGKLSKPESCTEGHFPVFTAAGQLRDGGNTAADFAPAVRAVSGPAATRTISDAVAGKPLDMTLYGPPGFAGEPSVTLPLTLATASNPSITQIVGSVTRTFHQMGVTLRAFRVPADSIELLTVNNVPLYSDSLKLDGTLIRRVGCKSFTGSENWSLSSSSPGLFYTSLTDAKIGTVSPCSCGHLRGLAGYDAAEVTSGDDLCFVHHVYQRFYCKRTACTTLEEWRAFLAAQNQAGHPLTVLYVLASPTSSTVEVSELPLIPLTTGRMTFQCSNLFFEMTYAADTTAYIERRLREVSA